MFFILHSLTLLLHCLHVYVVIAFLWVFWVGVNLYVFYTPFTDLVIVLSTCLCCHCFLGDFLIRSKSVCFLYTIHWPCYCTVYMFMLSLLSVGFLSGSKSVCFLYTIHWPWYCTVYMFMLSLFFRGLFN